LAVGNAEEGSIGLTTGLFSGTNSTQGFGSGGGSGFGFFRFFGFGVVADTTDTFGCGFRLATQSAIEFRSLELTGCNRLGGGGSGSTSSEEDPAAL
jgi:hypothetical protein